MHQLKAGEGRIMKKKPMKQPRGINEILDGMHQEFQKSKRVQKRCKEIKNLLIMLGYCK